MSVLLDGWRSNTTPLDLPVPKDPPPTLIDWSAIPAGHGTVEHEDSEDRLNPDDTWGPDDVGAVGGSGISFTYSSSDLDAVRVAEAAVFRRRSWYDWSHWVRQIRYSMAGYDMTHDALYARRLIVYADRARASWSEHGPISYGAGWTPQNLAQYHDMATKGIQQNGSFGREVGWVAWGEAMALKVNPRRDTTWLRMFKETCDLAANPKTGQIVHDTHAGVDGDDLEYTFHASIRNIAYLAACYRLKLRPRKWLFNWYEAVHGQTPIPYPEGSDCPSPPAFMHTVGGVLVPATGPAAEGDPAHGWWSSFCVAMQKVAGKGIEGATKFGPTDAGSEQAKKESMLYRGWMSQ